MAREMQMIVEVDEDKDKRIRMERSAFWWAKVLIDQIAFCHSILTPAPWNKTLSLTFVIPLEVES